MTSTSDSDFRWDFGALYAGADDAHIEQDLRQAANLAEEFRQRYRGTLGSERLDAVRLKQALGEFEQLQRLGLKPYFYAQLLFSLDSGSEAAKTLLAKVRESWSAIGETILFFELELLRLEQSHFEGLLEREELTGHDHYLRQLRAQAPFALSEEVEQALKRKDLSGKEAFTQLFEELTASLQFTFTMPGEEESRQVTGEELLSLLYHPDGVVREDAFSTFLNGHGERALVLSSCFNNILLDHGKEAELRRYPDLMTPTLLENETDRSMVDTLMAVTEDNYGLAQDYFALKKRLLGLERMKNSDLYAPLAAQARTFAFDEARALVLEAFGGFNAEMAEAAEGFFREGRIDVLPRPGKTGGAYCMGMMPGLSPYVLLNYTGNLRDVSTLAHELGHGVHFVLSQGQNFFNYQAPLPMAETASVFGEMLLTRHLLAHQDDRGVKIALLCAKLEDIIATTFRQNVLTRFEFAAHQRRGEGLLSADELCALWLQENAKLFGDAVEMIEPYRWGWSYIGHFIHARFYCYSYVFGELLVLSLYKRYLEEGSAFVPRYLDLLAAGGSRSPAELVAPFGIDLNDGAFWQQGYDLVRNLLQELKELVDQESL